MTEKFFMVEFGDGEFSRVCADIEQAEEEALEWLKGDDFNDRRELTIYEVKPVAVTKLIVANGTKMLGSDELLNSHLIGE